MSMTVVVIVAAAVFVLFLIGVGVIFFVIKSKSGKGKAQVAAHSSQPAFPPAGQQPSQHFGGSDSGASPPSWPPPQAQAAAPQWSQAPAATEPPAAPPMDWPLPEPAPPLPPPPPMFPVGSDPDPYATTPSVDASEIPANPDLFMTTPSTPRQTSMDLAPAHLRADDGSVIQLNRLTLRVGRHPDCDVVVPTPGTSRQHAEFAFRDGGWFVTDLNSGNGTFVNNVRVRSQQLAPGDEVRIDQTRFKFGAGT